MPESLFNKVAWPHLFNRTPPGDCFWNKCTWKFETKLFNLRLLPSLCNFNDLQIFVKLKFAVVKYNSKMSIIYHQIKFRKGIMNRSSIKKPFSKLSQYSQKNTSAGVSFYIKMQAFSPETLLKSGSNTGVSL